MRKFILLGVAMLSLVLVAVAVAVASPGGKGKAGPFASTSPDSGTCGNDWANDTFSRSFKVKPNDDGTFDVREDFKDGQFVTIAGASPGACQTGSDHGTLVSAGITGKFKGYLEGTVSGATQDDQNACDANPTPCDTTAGYIAATFGPAAVYDTPTFSFKYSAGGQGLAFDHWTNSSDGNAGDIASL